MEAAQISCAYCYILVDSGSSVTAMSDSVYQTLVCAGAPVGALGRTSRTLRGANGSRIEIQGFSHCVVSFMGLQTEFHILVCDLAVIRSRRIYMTFWTRRLEIWTTHSNDNWLASYFSTRICYLCLVRRLPVTRMRWNTKYIHEIVHQYAVHPAGCHLRNEKRRGVCW